MEESQTDSVCIEIAGVNFSVHCRNSEMPRVFDAAYAPFLRSGKDRSSLTIDIDLEFGDIPGMEGATKIFDTGQSWSLWFDGKVYSLSLSPAAFDGPVWMARFDPGFERITVFCRKTPEEDGGGSAAHNPVSYPLDQLLLMYILAQKGGVILHAAGMNLNAGGYIFPGRSGAGKSTLLRQFEDRRDAELLSDDRIVVRRIGTTFKAFGTPWPGEAQISANTSVPLQGIFFISHGTENRIREIDQKEAFEKMVPLASIPWYDRNRMTDVLIFCETMTSHIPAYELSFRPDRDVAAFLADFARGKGT